MAAGRGSPYTPDMATYSITEAQERLPDLLQRAAQGEEVIIATEFGAAAVHPVPRERKPMTAEDIAWIRAHRVKPLPGPTGAEIVRSMRDED